jgi:hypothetical protein
VAVKCRAGPPGALSSLHLPKKAGICVSIIVGECEYVPKRDHHQSYGPALISAVAVGAGAACTKAAPLSPVLLTMLTVFSSVLRILIILFPARLHD